MANKFSVSTVFSAVDQMTNPLQKINSRIESMGKTVQGVGKGIQERFGAIGGVLKAGALAVGTAAIAAGAAVFKLTNDVANAGDEIAKTSKALGISSNALQEFRYIGERSGVTVEEMTRGLEKLTINLGKESKTTVDALAMIGLSAEQLRAAGPDRSLIMVAEGMRNVTDPATRAAVAVELFGRNGAKLANVMAEGEAGMAALAAEAHRVGYVMSGDTLTASEGLNDAMLNMQTSVKAVGVSLASKFIPHVQRAVDSITELAISSRSGVVEAFGEIGNVMASAFESVLPVISGVLGILAPALNMVGKILKSIAPIFKLVAGLMAKIAPFIGVIAELVGELLAPAFEVLAVVLEPVFDILGAVFEVLTPVIKGITGFVKTAIATFNSLPGPVKALVALFNPVLAIPLLIQAAWGPIRDFFGRLWTSIQHMVEPVVGAIESVWEGIKSLFSGDFGAAADAFMEAWSGVGEFFSRLWANIQMVFMDVFGGMISIILSGLIEVGKALGQNTAGLQKMQSDIARSQINARVGAGVLDQGRLQEARQDMVSVGGVRMPSAMAAQANQLMGRGQAPTAPVSSQTTVNRNSTLDVNFNNAPAGTSMRQQGQAPGIRVNMGPARGQ
jgi:phage-related protein